MWVGQPLAMAMTIIFYFEFPNKRAELLMLKYTRRYSPPRIIYFELQLN